LDGHLALAVAYWRLWQRGRTWRLRLTDDREVNVRGAQALGITGHLFAGVTALRAFLKSLSDRPSEYRPPGRR
jgi:hypothetical protein